MFYMRVVKHWNGLPREVVEAPSLEACKVRLARTLSSLVKLKMSLLTAVGVGLDDLYRSLPTQSILRSTRSELEGLPIGKANFSYYCH